MKAENRFSSQKKSQMSKCNFVFAVVASLFFINCTPDKKLGGYIEPYGNANQPADTTFYRKEKELLMKGNFERKSCDSVFLKDFNLMIKHATENLENLELAVFISGVRAYQGNYHKVINLKDVRFCSVLNNLASMKIYVFDDQNSRIHKFSDGDWNYPILDKKYDKLEIELYPEKKTLHDSFNTDFEIKNIPDKIEYEKEMPGLK